MNDAGTFRPRFVSAFKLPGRWVAGEQAYVERFFQWAVDTGFNGVRVMGGYGWLEYPWTAANLNALTEFLEAAKSYGLYVELTAWTNTEDVPAGTNKHTLTQSIARRCLAARNTILELANEPEHPTQDREIHDVNFLKSLYNAAKQHAPSLLVALGASAIDELEVGPYLYPHAGGDYCTVHLRRSKPLDEQVSRIREMETIGDKHGVPVVSNEPLGADEKLSAKQRYIDPDFAFCHGLYCRIAEVGAVHHAEHGLQADLPGPNQQRCADAFIAGATIGLELGDLSFRNAREGGGPVKEANFRVKAGGATNPNGTVWRTIAGILGNTGLVAAIGLRGNRDPGIQWQGGWKADTLLADRPMVKVWTIST